MRKCRSERQLHFATPYFVPINFATATLEDILDARLRARYVEAVQTEWCGVWSPTNILSSARPDMSTFWKTKDFTFVGTNSTSSLLEHIQGVKGTFRLTKKELRERARIRYKAKCQADPNYRKHKNQTDRDWLRRNPVKKRQIEGNGRATKAAWSPRRKEAERDKAREYEKANAPRIKDRKAGHTWRTGTRR